MGRILFFLLLAMAAYIGYRWWRIRQFGGGASSRGSHGARPGGEAEAMVRCETCGLNLPKSDALPAPDGGSRWYCCEDHRRQGTAAR